MPQKTPSHHHHATILSLLPIGILALSSFWTEIQLTPVLAHAEESANRSEQELALLDTRYRDMQKALNLLTTGEEKVQYPSLALYHFNEHLSSPVDRQENAIEYIEALNQRIGAFKKQFEEIY
jgi:hypothetical protein